VNEKSELGLRGFLEDGQFKGFTTNFQVLHGLKQLPGLAVQRLMADGYGFGAEGDWKTCALFRAVKAMAADLKGGTSFMEDLHLPSSSRRSPGAWLAHAGGLQIDCRGKALPGSSQIL
jgi:L-arabinose isomerase